MGLFDKLNPFKKKNNSLIANKEEPDYEGYHEDLSDEGSEGLNVNNDPSVPVDFNSNSSTVEPPKISEYERTVRDFTRLNNDQLDPESKTSMKHKKEKTFFGSIMKKIKKNYYDLKDSAKNGADAAADVSFEISQSTKTAEEKNYKGLKKSHIYIAVGAFCLLTGMGLLFANGSDSTQKQQPAAAKSVTGANLRETDKQASSGSGALAGLPKTYSDKVEDDKTVNGLDVSGLDKKNSDKLREDAKNDSRGKTDGAANQKKDIKSESGASGPAKSVSSNVAPPMPSAPGVPPMPGSNVSQVRVRETVSQVERAEAMAKENAIKSNISFGISNGGVK